MRSANPTYTPPGEEVDLGTDVVAVKDGRSWSLYDGGDFLFSAYDVPKEGLPSVLRAFLQGMERGEKYGRIKLQGELRRLIGATP